MKLLTGKPTALPGSCYLCASATREQYIDLETDVDFHGAMYLCDSCVTQLGSLIDMLPPKEKLELQNQAIKAQREIERLEGENSGLRKVLDGYDDVRASLTLDSQSASSSGSTESAGSEGERKLEGRKKGSSKQSDDEGVAVVRTGESGSKSTSF